MWLEACIKRSINFYKSCHNSFFVKSAIFKLAQRLQKFGLFEGKFVCQDRSEIAQSGHADRDTQNVSLTLCDCSWFISRHCQIYHMRRWHLRLIVLLNNFYPSFKQVTLVQSHITSEGVNQVKFLTSDMNSGTFQHLDDDDDDLSSNGVDVLRDDVSKSTHFNGSRSSRLLKSLQTTFERHFKNTLLCDYNDIIFK